MGNVWKLPLIRYPPKNKEPELQLMGIIKAPTTEGKGTPSTLPQIESGYRTLHLNIRGADADGSC